MGSAAVWVHPEPLSTQPLTKWEGPVPSWDCSRAQRGNREVKGVGAGGADVAGTAWSEADAGERPAHSDRFSGLIYLSQEAL